MRVSVIGLGKLGSPIAASIASRGHSVVGFDVNATFLEAFRAHRAPVLETGLQELIDANKARIRAASSAAEAVTASDLTFVVVPTPSQSDGAFTNKFVVSACEAIGAALKDKKDFHVVAISSTMMPGSSEREIIPTLEKASGKKAGKDFGYCYNPSLIALGSVVHDYLNPELIMIGEGDPRSGALLESFCRSVMGEAPVIHRVAPAEAELAKLALNTYITTKISFANMLGMIADGMPGVNVDNVTKIVGSDARVGPKYLKAGGSYGGPCFPRDNRAIARAAQLVGVSTHIPQAADATNRQRIEHVAMQVETALARYPGGTVGIVGIAYKPDTEVADEAMGVHLVKYLRAKGVQMVVYDPHAAHTAKKIFGDSVEHADSLEACLAASHVVAVTNPYKKAFAALDPSHTNGKTIVDCWNVVPRLS